MQNLSFRTEFISNPSDVKFTLKDQILTIGSCFSDNIGEKMTNYKFRVMANPFGTVYNPISIFKLIGSSGINSRGFVKYKDLVVHHDYHSDLRAVDQRLLENTLADIKTRVNNFVKTANWLVITLGTAWVYEHQATGEVVSNCHKVPQKMFNKRILGMKEMVTAFDQFYEKVMRLNPDIKLLLTVSPVRHTKDGLAENQLSKSMLRVLSDFCVTSYDNVHYFPSYEIMMDDLRDYRFYKDDMLHPTEFAENYIWKKLVETHFDEPTKEFVDEWQSILSAINHRPFNPTSEDHQKFVKVQIDKLNGLANKIDVSYELKYFEK